MIHQKGKIRVALFGDDFSRKGKGTALVIRKIAEELVLHHAEEVELILLRPAGECTGIVCERSRSVVIPRKFSTLASYVWFFLTHRASYDVVVFNRVVYPGFWMMLAKRRILFMHDASKSEVYTVSRTRMNAFFERVAMFHKRSLDIVVAVSEDAKKWITEYFGFPRSSVRVLYGGVGPEFRPISEEKKDAQRARFSETPYILDVSRFDPHKNIERVLEAFFLLKEEGVPHSLVFVGGAHTPGYSERMYEKIAASRFAKDIRVVDYVEEGDMPALYACADLLLYPSLAEGFGLPILEAMKSGIPVVTSAVSSMPEVAGGAAMLVNPLDAHSIAEGVRKVFDKKRRAELIEGGIRRASEFSWGRAANEFLAMIR